MDALTIGQKIKEVTGKYGDIPDEALGLRYLEKYGWVLTPNDIGGASVTNLIGNVFGNVGQAAQSFMRGANTVKKGVVPQVSAAAKQVYDITQKNEDWLNRMSKPGAIEDEIYGLPGSVKRRLLLGE